MKKNTSRFFIVLGIILVVFSIIAFAVPFSMTGSFWMGYIFGVIAIALQVYVFQVAFADGNSAKSKFYGFPIAKIGVFYLVAQLIISIIEMAVASVIPVWVSVVINVLVLAVAVIGCIAAEITKDEVVRQDVQIKKDVSNMRELQSLSASLVNLSNDTSIKAMLQDLADEFKYSDPVSSDASLPLEKNLISMLNGLKQSLTTGDTSSASSVCTSIKNGLAERNRVNKLSK